MFIILLMCSIHHSIANPILLFSGSGTNLDTGSGTNLDTGSETNYNDDDHHTCDTTCKVFVISICCAPLLCFLCFITLAIYDILIKYIIKNCVQFAKKNKYCICCMKHTTRNNQINYYIENTYYEKNKKETSFYHTFISIYGKVNRNKTPINTECPICLDSIEKDMCILHCNHAYHTKCMKEYMNNDNYNQQCPLCRKTINI